MIMLLVALLACTPAPDAHDHGDGHGHDHGEGAHKHEAPGSTAEAAAPADNAAKAVHPAPTEPVEAWIGAHTVRLQPSAEALTLTLLGADAEPVKPSGEAKVVLTASDGASQRLVLKPTGDGWSAAARAAGASGYVAVVSMDIDGSKQVTRLAWGDAPTPAAAPAHPHGSGGGHPQGSGGHDHGPGGHKH
jgi:hypothetical protein